VHPSNATRICDKLVEEGLLHRSDNLANRRQLVLQLTESGRHLIDTMTEDRRTAIANILAKMRSCAPGDVWWRRGSGCHVPFVLPLSVGDALSWTVAGASVKPRG
jgi:MarR family